MKFVCVTGRLNLTKKTHSLSKNNLNSKTRSLCLVWPNKRFTIEETYPELADNKKNRFFDCVGVG